MIWNYCTLTLIPRIAYSKVVNFYEALDMLFYLKIFKDVASFNFTEGNVSWMSNIG